MEKAFKVIVILLMTIGVSYGGIGLTGTVQKAYNTLESRYIYSVGFMKKSRFKRLYHEAGINFLSQNYKPEKTITDYNYQKKYTTGLVGLYTVTYVIIAPIFRPGVVTGLSMVKSEIHKSMDNEKYVLSGYTDYEAEYNIGLSLQAGIFSFMLTNAGIGGGINYQFK